MNRILMMIISMALLIVPMGRRALSAGRQEESTVNQTYRDDEFMQHAMKIMGSLDEKIAVLERLKKETDNLILLMEGSGEGGCESGVDQVGVETEVEARIATLFSAILEGAPSSSAGPKE